MKGDWWDGGIILANRNLDSLTRDIGECSSLISESLPRTISVGVFDDLGARSLAVPP